MYYSISLCAPAQEARARPCDRGATRRCINAGLAVLSHSRLPASSKRAPTRTHSTDMQIKNALVYFFPMFLLLSAAVSGEYLLISFESPERVTRDNSLIHVYYLFVVFKLFLIEVYVLCYTSGKHKKVKPKKFVSPSTKGIQCYNCLSFDHPGCWDPDHPDYANITVSVRRRFTCLLFAI